MIVLRLKDLFPDSAHVHDCELGASADSAIWDFATKTGYVIISKDLDFHDRTVMGAANPKVIGLRSGNCSTDHVEQVLRSFSRVIQHFEEDQASALLILP